MIYSMNIYFGMTGNGGDKDQLAATMGNTARTSCLQVMYYYILAESEKVKNPFLVLDIGISRNSPQKYFGVLMWDF